ncbi:MAG: xanthine dehydrogenase family protein subunit M, partial [Pseudomonadota bacterium]
MIPGAFEYHRPSSVSAAIGLLADLGGEARVVAGGHSLIPMMKLRMALPEHLVDLRDIDGLSGVSEEGGDLVIGAMTTQAELIASQRLSQKCPILGEASLLIADPQVRYCGTIGGNVANGDPGNDMPAIMQALDAKFVLEGANGSREVAARGFYEAAYETARQDDEILTSIRIPTPASGHGHAYEKQKRKVGDYATAAAAVILAMDGTQCRAASIALTNVGDTPLYAEAASNALVGTPVDDAAIVSAAAEAEAITDPASDG